METTVSWRAARAVREQVTTGKATVQHPRNGDGQEFGPQGRTGP